MKKLLKAIVCILIAGLTVFGFVAKYQTHGIYLGQTVDISQLEAAAQAAGSKLISSDYTPCYCTYQNAFGKSVVIAQGNLSYQSSRCIFHFSRYPEGESCLLCEFSKNRIIRVQAFSPAIANHSDFLGYFYDGGSFFTLVQKAGVPTSYSIGHGSPDGITHRDSGFVFETFDGYRYYLTVRQSGKVSISCVETPAGEHLSPDAIRQLGTRIVIFHLSVAAALTVFLICLLKIHGYCQKKKAEKRGIPYIQNPHGIRRFIIAVLCILLVLGSVIHLGARLDCWVFHPDTSEKYIYREENTIQDSQYCILRNACGEVAVTARDQIFGNSVTRPICFSPQKHCTHLSMLSLCQGMPSYLLYPSAGIPDSTKGSIGQRRVIFETCNGYTYDIPTHGGTVGSWTVTAPDGTQLDTAAFQWQVRLIYLAIAAGLGILAAALAIPNHIRKRKAAI